MATSIKTTTRVQGRNRAMAAAFAGVLAVVVAVLVALAWQRPVLEPAPAAPAQYLDDQAGLLSPAFVAAKNQYIEHLSRTMKIAQINVVILPRVPGGSVEDFTIRAATAWKLGAAGVDNGLLLFIFRDERLLRLEVGYGLEAVIPDALAERLLAEQVVPAFSRGQYETGVEDFLDVLDKTLEASEAASRRAAPYAAMIPFVLNVLRNAPRIAVQAWSVFVQADMQGRMVLGLFASVLAASLAWALVGIAAGIVPLVCLPLRLLKSTTLRTLGSAAVRAQFTAKNFFARPPPVFNTLAQELQLGEIFNAVYLLAGAVVGIAFLFVGSSILIGGLGHFGGAGATLGWPAP